MSSNENEEEDGVEEIITEEYIYEMKKSKCRKRIDSLLID